MRPEKSLGAFFVCAKRDLKGQFFPDSIDFSVLSIFASSRFIVASCPLALSRTISVMTNQAASAKITKFMGLS